MTCRRLRGTDRRTAPSGPENATQRRQFCRNRDNAAVRINPGLFDQEAYGIKTTASELLRFIEASVAAGGLSDDLQAALRRARTGAYKVDAMHQGLGWELYAAPARLKDLRQGVDMAFVLEPNAVERSASPVTGKAVGTVSKTGSTAASAPIRCSSRSVPRQS